MQSSSPSDVPTSFGSNAGTQIEQTSSNDNVISAADRWIVTSDNGSVPDVIVTTVIYGQGTPAATPTAVIDTVCSDGTPGNAGIGFPFTITIPANASRSLMFFADMGDIQGTNNTRLPSGLPNSERLEILNRDFAATTTTAATTDEDTTFIDDFIGCSVGNRKANDPTLLLLVLLAMSGLALKRRQSTSRPPCRSASQAQLGFMQGHRG